MNNLIFNESPIVANKTLARAIGLNESIILQQIHYWIELNRKTEKNYYDGYYWTYNSIKEWQEKDFDYMSYDTIKRALNKLEKEQFIIIGYYNKDRRDRTKWYTINYDKLEQLTIELNSLKEKTKADNSVKASQIRISEEREENSINSNNEENIKVEYKDYNDELNKLIKETNLYDEDDITEEVKSILKILAEVMVLSPREEVKINQKNILAETVQKRFSELNHFDIYYIKKTIEEYPVEIKNYKAFILTVAYNAKQNRYLNDKRIDNNKNNFSDKSYSGKKELKTKYMGAYAEQDLNWTEE